jgi:hypothetical protein
VGLGPGGFIGGGGWGVVGGARVVSGSAWWLILARRTAVRAVPPFSVGGRSSVRARAAGSASLPAARGKGALPAAVRAHWWLVRSAGLSVRALSVVVSAQLGA